MPASSLPPSAKKRKVKPDADLVKKLEVQITDAATNDGSLNPLVDLLNLAQGTSDPADLSKIIYSLYRVFVVITCSDKLAPGGGDAAKQVRKWIWERLDAFVHILVGLLQDEESALRKSALDILFSLLRHLSSSLSKVSPDGRPQFHHSHFKHIVRGLLICPPSPRSSSNRTCEGKLMPDVRDHFVATWLSVYDDVRWCFLREASSVLSRFPAAEYPNLAANLLCLVDRLTTFPTEASELNAWWIPELGEKPFVRGDKFGADDEEDLVVSDTENEDDWRKFFDEQPKAKDIKRTTDIKGRVHQLSFHQSLHSLKAHRAVFTRMWLSLLPRLSLDTSDTSRSLAIRALNIMHRGILPHLTRAILVMDWIGACVDTGGTVGLLALNALFTLMKDYNLDYPQFYTRLYAFLDKDILHLKHRARFFRLTELFLSSTHLPAALLASFVKRLSRLSLSAPPAAIIMIIPFTYNILKRHPALMKMIHRADDDHEPLNDTYIANEANPNATNAINSSLWELLSHRKHYDTAVSTLARIFEEAFTKPGYSMEDFLDHTYGTLLENELQRKIKKEPALATELVQDPFPLCTDPAIEADEGIASDSRDVISELWAFD
ncbi:CBF/Mak21 family-domain-containing protein [Pisolithus marmoratus]|nr:CBF/Mak21 family-domain-containing protein [Pisolithus marmoratus]